MNYLNSPACWAGNVLLVGGMVGVRPTDNELAGPDAGSQAEQVFTLLF